MKICDLWSKIQSNGELETDGSGGETDLCCGSMLSDGKCRGWLSESFEAFSEFSSVLVVVVDDGRALAASINVLPICGRLSAVKDY